MIYELAYLSRRNGFWNPILYVMSASFWVQPLLRVLSGRMEVVVEFARAIRAFLDDLSASKLANQVLLMAFNEFGRAPRRTGRSGPPAPSSSPA